MTDPAARVLDAIEGRRADRRRFLGYAGGAVAATGGLSLLAACGNDGTSNPVATPTPTPTATATAAVSDIDVLNFALNLEYLEAQFYNYAAYGTGISASLLTGIGTQGTVKGGAQVAFTDPLVAQYAREIAQDEVTHVTFLRSLLNISATPVAIAMPSIDIDGSSATSAFSLAAQAAGIVPAGTAFNPYASDENFLLAAYLFEDVGVTAYKGASPLLTNKTYLAQAAGILAVEAYHAGLIRSVLYRKGIEATPSLLANAQKLSDARDGLDGSGDDDQGIGDATTANIVPADPTTGIAYSRSTGQVLNIAYLTRAQATKGGFFPAGTNGSIFTSAAS